MVWSSKKQKGDVTSEAANGSEQQQPPKSYEKPHDGGSKEQQQPPKSSLMVVGGNLKQQQAPRISQTAPGVKSMKPQLSKTSQKASPWSKATPSFVFGQPMLSDAELQSIGSATSTLHAHYLQACAAKKKNGILVMFKRMHFFREWESECFLVGFKEMYDLFNFEGLTVSLLRCFTLSMVQETRAKALPVGFLDPELMSLSTITADKSYVADYVRKAFQHYAKKRCIMFAHNTNDHWVLVVVIPKWNKVLYLDSLRSRPRDHKMLKEVLNEAFLSHCTLKKISNSSLAHVTKFPCHQQTPGNTCGFYTAQHMMEAMGLLDVEDDPEGFEVMTTPLDMDMLNNIREKITSFIMSQVVNVRGEFHCKNRGSSVI